MPGPTPRLRPGRVFRTLLRLLPFDVRLEHGREMEQVFLAQQQEARQGGTVGAGASIFTIINAFLFRPLPVHRPEQLVSIATLDKRHMEMPHGVSFRDLQDSGG